MSNGGSGAPQIPMSDIDNMKVPELKKRLKTMGLSTSGNKAELVERLQDAYLGEKDGSLEGGLDDDSLEEALLDDDPENRATPETSLTGGEEFSFSSAEKEVHRETVTKPLKKRAIAHIEHSDSPAKAPKPIVIKRDNYPTIEFSKEATEEKKDHPVIKPPKPSESVKAMKVMTETERMQLRAQRFNIEDPKPKVAVVAPSTSLTTNNLEVLRKRAERFGENVSTVMKKLENQEKLLKRKMKFNDSASTEKSLSFQSKPLSSEQEKRQKRMERFGLLK